jgi:hypothetical protein
VTDNSSLASLEGLFGVEFIAGELSMHHNESLSQCEVDEWVSGRTSIGSVGDTTTANRECGDSQKRQ